MRIPQSASSRWLIGVALAVLVLVIVSVVVALVNRQRDVDLFPADTPEGGVQRYLLALEDGEYRTAYNYLNASLQERCSYQHFVDSTRFFQGEDRRISLEDKESLNGQVRVRVRITEFDFSPPFNTSEYSFSVDFILEQTGAEWRFTEPPWPMGWCPGLDRPASSAVAQ